MFITRFVGRRFLAVAASARSESTTAAAASTVKIAKNPLEEFFEFDRSQDEDKPVVYASYSFHKPLSQQKSFCIDFPSQCCRDLFYRRPSAAVTVSINLSNSCDMMEEIKKPGLVETIKREAPQLATVLREMKEGLDVVRSKVEALTAKVKADSYPTADGMSYLEAKHLLLLSYCQCLVYYLLRKAKGFSIDGHPVVRSLVEIRMFLEKIRPIDKKLQYQIQKLTTAGASVTEQTLSEGKEAEKSEDVSNYKPKPDLLADKMEDEPLDGVYRPPKFAPMSMDDKTSKQERDAARKEKHFLRQATENTYMKDVLDELEDRPEEIRDWHGAESKEQRKFIAQYERQQEVEEELFARAPRTKEDKKREKRLKSRSGLHGLTESFDDEFKFLDEDGEKSSSFGGSGRKSGGRSKRRKV
ncbi:unnamed protein product [Brassica rapa]|uniref:Sas10 C-terminal domain-containing protein n=2 Tax=Brassica campestris TaxID=3711 RepID=A0A8D9D3K8_BRACM|nr:unnamed protein product [Brassica rapa]